MSGSSSSHSCIHSGSRQIRLRERHAVFRRDQDDLLAARQGDAMPQTQCWLAEERAEAHDRAVCGPIAQLRPVTDKDSNLLTCHGIKDHRRISDSISSSHDRSASGQSCNTKESSGWAGGTRVQTRQSRRAGEAEHGRLLCRGARRHPCERPCNGLASWRELNSKKLARVVRDDLEGNPIEAGQRVEDH
jgi:hypothetical protein